MFTASFWVCLVVSFFLGGLVHVFVAHFLTKAKKRAEKLEEERKKRLRASVRKTLLILRARRRLNQKVKQKLLDRTDGTPS